MKAKAIKDNIILLDEHSLNSNNNYSALRSSILNYIHFKIHPWKWAPSSSLKLSFDVFFIISKKVLHSSLSFNSSLKCLLSSSKHVYNYF